MNKYLKIYIGKCPICDVINAAVTNLSMNASNSIKEMLDSGLDVSIIYKDNVRVVACDCKDTLNRIDK